MTADKKNQTEAEDVKAANTMIENAQATKTGAGDLLMVTFTLADQTYGGDILQIQEVTAMSHITRVPHVRSYIKGVTNLRGNIVPTLDLRTRLGLAGNGEKLKNQQIMIARTDQGLLGYIVDTVREVITVPRSAIEPTPEDWLDADLQYFIGIAKLKDHLVTLVDFNRVVHSEKALVDEIKTV